MGEPCGVLMATGENLFGEPWKRSRHIQLVRKLPAHETLYLCVPLALRAAVSWDGSTLSNPPLISRNREETLRSSRWMMRISWARVTVASMVERPTCVVPEYSSTYILVSLVVKQKFQVVSYLAGYTIGIREKIELENIINYLLL